MCPLQGVVSLGSLFGDHMVIQQGCPIPVWGEASPGERILVSCAGVTSETTTDSDGRWRVMLPPLAKGTSPLEMRIDGESHIVVRDILVGDVWLASGSGEIHQTLSKFPGAAGSIAMADYGTRFFIPHSAVKGCEARGSWVVVSPSASGDLPAVPFFFARDLRATRQTAIGILDATIARDTPVSSWIGGEGKRGLSPMLPPVATNLFRELIKPLAPYPLTGMIWGQGYSDEGEGAWRHRLFLHHLVRDWRKTWGQGPTPFLILSPAGKGSAGPSVESWRDESGHCRRGWPWIRDGIQSLLDLPATGVVEAFDLGGGGTDATFDALIAGRRAALQARNMVYGEEPLASTGPRYRSMSISKGRIRLRFDNDGGGLAIGSSSSSEESTTRHTLEGFAIREHNGKWFPAEALIDGDEVVLRSPSVRRPEAVRYGWSGIPQGNLFSRAGLPASPFRTDRDQPE